MVRISDRVGGTSESSPSARARRANRLTTTLRGPENSPESCVCRTRTLAGRTIIRIYDDTRRRWSRRRKGAGETAARSWISQGSSGTTRRGPTRGRQRSSTGRRKTTGRLQVRQTGGTSENGAAGSNDGPAGDSPDEGTPPWEGNDCRPNPPGTAGAEGVPGGNTDGAPAGSAPAIAGSWCSRSDSPRADETTMAARGARCWRSSSSRSPARQPHPR